ncbi:MAG: class I SAM-dependent methyltransferase [Anaerolineales bacterium]|uniref:Class I SAM-dependent methyltransferase n=1 Tax=Candidatus Desulfolinea nitratireducens TaxID=2841698 RepID=A0A8J6NLM0_9CHLR|nr:class I SAM-dependent methyltransferase [Candidatus Desulfolinea nitratireducens]MBL6961307.1 class I SAM-dependent methyltransferase [Anaerolineales bacterium]
MPFDHFNLLAPIYERVISPPDIELMLKHLAPGPGSLLLDAGGGTGRVSGLLTEYFGPVILSDISMGMLKQAGEKNGLRPARALTETMPFAGALFDRILLVDALHHVNDQAETASELWRILKPGGRIVIQEPDIRQFAVKLIAIAEKLALMRSHFLDPQAITDIFLFDGAKVEIYSEDFSVWVIIKKMPG